MLELLFTENFPLNEMSLKAISVLCLKLLLSELNKKILFLNTKV